MRFVVVISYLPQQSVLMCRTYNPRIRVWKLIALIITPFRNVLKYPLSVFWYAVRVFVLIRGWCSHSICPESDVEESDPKCAGG